MKYVIAAAALFFAVQASAQERRIVYDFVGFSGDGKYFVVKKYDYNVGWSYDLRSIHDGTREDRFSFDESSEERVLKRLKRKYKLKEGSSPKSPDGRFVVMGAEDGKYLDVLVMEKSEGKIGRFKDLPLKEKKGTGRKPDEYGEGLLKKAVWSPDGKYVVAIAQMTSPEGGWQEDEIFSWKFRSWKVDWFYADEKKSEKKGGGAR